MAVCSDPDRTWFPQRSICHVTMEQAAAQARYSDKHEGKPYHNGKFTSWSEKRGADHPYEANEGVTIWVHDVDLSPEDRFLS